VLSIRRLTAQGWLVVALLVGIAGVRVFALVHGVRVEANQYDINRFYAIAHSAGTPYRDYPVEYPPLTVLLLKAVAAVLHSRGRFGDGMLLLSLGSEIAIGAVLWRTWGLRAALAFLLIDSVLIALLITRLDLVSTALTVAAVAAALRRRDARLVEALRVHHVDLAHQDVGRDLVLGAAELAERRQESQVIEGFYRQRQAERPCLRAVFGSRHGRKRLGYVLG